VLGPDETPIVTERSKARALPELASLSVIAHRADRCALDVGRAAIDAVRDLDEATMCSCSNRRLNARSRTASSSTTSTRVARLVWMRPNVSPRSQRDRTFDAPATLDPVTRLPSIPDLWVVEPRPPRERGRIRAAPTREGHAGRGHHFVAPGTRPNRTMARSGRAAFSARAATSAATVVLDDEDGVTTRHRVQASGLGRRREHAGRERVSWERDIRSGLGACRIAFVGHAELLGRRLHRPRSAAVRRCELRAGMVILSPFEGR
jgi:hypothetical protein